MALARPRLDVSGRVAGRWEALPKPAKIGVAVLLVAFLYLLPNFTIPILDTPGVSFAGILFYPIAIYALVAIGLNIVVGEAGLLDLGYVAFFAIGAYTTGLLAGPTKGDLPFLVALPAAVIVSMLAGVLLGLPTLRLRGDYLAIVTLGFGEIIRITAVNSDWLGGPRGINNIPHPPNVLGLEFGVIDPKPYYWFALTVIIVVIFLVKRLERSRVGRAWTAIREDEDAAELMGVPTFKFKLWAFACGAGIGGLAGSIFAGKVISINPDNFEFILSILFLAAVVLGGSGNMAGAVAGAALIAYLPERFRGFEERRVLIFGLALVVMMIFRPQGLLPSRRRAAELAEAQPGDAVMLVSAEVADSTAADVDADDADRPAEAAGTGDSLPEPRP